MTKIIPKNIKRSRWLWPAGALFLFVLLAMMVWNRNLADQSADPLTATERAWLKAHPVIRLAPDPDFPPVEFFTKAGGYDGITADYVALIEKKLGIQIEIVRLRDWDEIIAKAKSRQIDTYIATKNPQRAKYMLFTKPYLEFPVVIITREKVKGPLNLEKLGGMKISVVSGYAAHDFIAGNYPNVHLDPVPDVRTGLQKVSFGLSDAFVENLATASHYIEKEGVTNLRISGESGYSYKMGFCSRKDWPELNSILEKGLARISADEKKALYKKWVPLEPRSLFTSKEFQTGLFVVFGAIIMIAAGIIAWNRALARQVMLRTGELENELAERKRVEEHLERARDELEKRVEERTAKLAETVRALQLSQFCIDKAAIGIYHTTPEGDILSANEFACQSLGYTADELLALKVPDIDPVITRKKTLEIKESLESAGSVTHESVHRRKDGTTFPVEIVTNTLEFQRKSYAFSFVKDITGRKRTENINMARLRLLQFAGTHTLDELLEATLDEAEALTGSLTGFYHFLKADQKTLALQNWSTRTKAEFCKTKGKGRHYDVSDAGVWADCIRERRPVIHNDYTSLPNRKGIPPDHAQVMRELVVPVFRGDSIVAILGVGNKPADYASEDMETISLLADLAWEITERKQAVEALQEANLVVENSPVVLFRCKPVPGWPVELVSRNVVQFGYEPEEFLSGKLTYASIVYPPDLEKIAAETEVFAATGEGQLLQEYRIVTRQEEIRWIIDETNCERNEEGEITHFEGVIIDVTERKLAEDALRKANLVVENSPVVLFRWKPSDEWPVELVSTNIIQFGYEPDEFLSGSITYSSIIHPDDRERVTREVHNFCNEQANQFRLEYRIITKWGYVRWVNEHSNIERDAAGVIWNFEGIVIDITERKLADEELQQQKQLLQELNVTLERRVEDEVKKNREKDIVLIQQNRQAALGEMLDHIAHQWKQPLNSISLIVQEMAYCSSDGELTDKHVQATNSTIMSLLDHMAQTIDVFRSFYRPDKETKLFSIKESIDQALAFIAPTFRFHSIAVELDVDPGLTGFGYPREYTQVLLNILANAKDVFRARQTESPRVIVRAFAEGPKTVVTITDNAGGIPEVIMNKIFDFYFTTNEATGGTGIGLYMSRNIIEKNMGGTLSAENADGGARFRIETPPA